MMEKGPGDVRAISETARQKLGSVSMLVGGHPEGDGKTRKHRCTRECIVTSKNGFVFAREDVYVQPGFDEPRERRVRY